MQHCYSSYRGCQKQENGISVSSLYLHCPLLFLLKLKSFHLLLLHWTVSTLHHCHLCYIKCIKVTFSRSSHEMVPGSALSSWTHFWACPWQTHTSSYRPSILMLPFKWGHNRCSWSPVQWVFRFWPEPCFGWIHVNKMVVYMRAKVQVPKDLIYVVRQSTNVYS